MRMRPVRLLCVIAVLAAGAVTGCGEQRSDGGTRITDGDRTDETRERARRVAEAWDGSRAADVYRRGFYPMADVVQLPEHAFRSGSDKEAYLMRNFGLRGDLPASDADKGEVAWDDGRSLTLPMMDARETLAKLDRDSGGGPELVVTGARLGTMKMVTSRGPATVPAWLFTLDGYDTPLKRVALNPSEQPEPPIGPAADTPSNELWPLQQLMRTSRDGRSVTVLAGHGSCDDGPAAEVLETDGSVVLSGWIRDPGDGPCTADLKLTEVTVKLAGPVGDRVLLDAFTGRPVPYGDEPGSLPDGS
ncbi:hypothetical protein ABZZ79_15945 [Streptomyces sp. NPDC006458]|uniref:hypothetical protein n=1 Tax=Streptomyces sp. NPDC006458 TaxID=3154302 RepID=UPI0033AF5E44